MANTPRRGDVFRRGVFARGPVRTTSKRKSKPAKVVKTSDMRRDCLRKENTDNTEKSRALRDVLVLGVSTAGSNERSSSSKRNCIFRGGGGGRGAA